MEAYEVLNDALNRLDSAMFGRTHPHDPRPLADVLAEGYAEHHQREADTLPTWSDFETSHASAARRIDNAWLTSSTWHDHMTQINAACGWDIHEAKLAVEALFAARTEYREAEIRKAGQ